MSMITLKNISKKYNDQIIFRDLNIQFPDNGIIVLNGKNGVGKTTLLNMIANIDSDYSGEIFVVNNLNTLKKEPSKLVDYMLKIDNLIDELTVSENLQLFEQADLKLVEQFNLTHLLNTKVQYLSNGEKARLSLIVTISHNAPIILCDEPTDALDEENKEIFVNILKELAKNKLIIIASHDKIFKKDDFFEIKVQETININYYSNEIGKESEIITKRKLKLIHSLKMWYKTKFFIPKLFIAMSTIALFLFFGNFILIIFGVEVELKNAYAENVIQVTAIDDSKDNTLGSDVNNALESNSDFTNIYYYDFMESSTTSYDSSVVVDGNISKPASYKSEFTTQEMQNNQYFIGTNTAQVSIDPETGYTIVDAKTNDNSGFINESTAYKPAISFIPPSEILSSSPSDEFFTNLNISGTMPSSQNEILITNEFMQLAFNTNNPSDVIGKEYVTHCFDGYEQTSTSTGYEWTYSTCNHYLITGVYEVTPTSGAKLYVPYSSYAANHYKKDYSNASTAYLTTNKSPELVINELENDISQNVNIAIPSQYSLSDKLLIATNEASAYTTFIIVMSIFALMILILLIINNIVSYKYESKRYLVLKIQHFSRIQVIKDIFTNEFANILLLIFITLIIALSINANIISFILMLGILLIVAIINIIYKLLKTSKGIYGTKKLK